MNNTLKYFIILSLIILFNSCSCKKQVTDSNGLPPATQTGANTFGFLLNGQAWTPQGFTGNANLSLDIDFTYRNGIFNIAAYKLITGHSGQNISIGITDSLNFITIPKTYSLGANSLYRVYYVDDITKCEYSVSDTTIYRNGNLTITKLDKTNGIISGIFNVILFKQGCDTVRITQGRFDMKF